MKNIIMRPLAFAALSFFAISCLLADSSATVKLIVLLLSSAVATAATFIPHFKSHRAERRFAIFSAVALMLAATVSLITFDLRYASVLKYAGVSDSITAKITSVNSTTSYSGYYTAEITKIGEKNVSFSASVLLDNPGFDEGDIITADAAFSAFAKSSSGFREEAYNLSKGIMLSAECENVEYIRSSTQGIGGIFERLNSRLSGIFFAVLGRNEGGLAAAIFLGNRDKLSAELKHDIRALGLSHLLALSGMHMSIVAGSASFVLEKLTRRKKLSRIGTIAFVLFYMALTGFSPSVTRAGIMMIIFSLSCIFDRMNDRLTSLGVACAAIVFVNPFSALDIGLQLSAVSMLACFAASDIIERSHIKAGRRVSKLISYFLFSLLTSVASIILTLPIICAYFGELSVIAPISNLVFIPLFTVLLYAAPIILIAFPAPHFLRVVVSAVKPLFTFTIKFAEIAARDEFLISLKYPFATFLSLAVTASAVVLFLSKKRVKLIALSALMIFSSAFAVDIALCRTIADKEVNIYTLNRKKSDAIVVISDSHALIIDISDGSYSAVSGALNCAEENAVVTVDAYMLTHYHKKHVAQIRKIASSHTVRELWLPPPQSDSDISIAESLTELADEMGITVFQYGRGENERIEFHDASICVCDYVKLKRSTHPVITLAISAKGMTYLYIGSSALESDISLDFASRRLTAADHIYIGAHGPITKQSISINATGAKLIISPLVADSLDPALPVLYKDELRIAEATERVTLKE